MHSLIVIGSSSTYDFGYTGAWVYGHLWLAAAVVPLALGAWRFRLSKWIQIPLFAIAAWALTGAAIVGFVFRMNDTMDLPSDAFLKGQAGKVLDIGAGSGRATVMVLTNRPGVTVTALDNWSADYIDHNSDQRLLANAKAAGGEGRVEVKTGDMRELPFPDATFDGIVSTYAIDHLNRAGSTKAMREAARVLKPGGDFFLAVMNGDMWTMIAYGPHFHGHSGSVLPRWQKEMKDAGLTVVDSGTRPWTAYILGRKARL